MVNIKFYVGIKFLFLLFLINNPSYSNKVQAMLTPIEDKSAVKTCGIAIVNKELPAVTSPFTFGDNHRYGNISKLVL